MNSRILSKTQPRLLQPRRAFIRSVAAGSAGFWASACLYRKPTARLVALRDAAPELASITSALLPSRTTRREISNHVQRFLEWAKESPQHWQLEEKYIEDLERIDQAARKSLGHGLADLSPDELLPVLLPELHAGKLAPLLRRYRRRTRIFLGHILEFLLPNGSEEMERRRLVVSDSENNIVRAVFSRYYSSDGAINLCYGASISPWTPRPLADSILPPEALSE